MSRFRGDAAWSAGGTLVPVLLGAAAVPVLLHSLAADQFTAFAMGMVVISFAPSLDLGLARTTFRRVAAARVQQPALAAHTAGLAVQHAARIGVCLALLMAVLLGTLALTGLVSASDVSALRWPLAVALLGVPPAIVANTQRAAIEGAGLFRQSAVTRIALGMLGAVVPVALALVFPSATLLCLALVLLRIATLLHQHSLMAGAGLVERAWQGLWRWPSRNGPPLGRAFWSESVWHGLAAPAAVLMSGFDRFVVMAVSGLSIAQLAVFLAPQDVALKAIIIPASVIPALVVRLADASQAPGQGLALSERLLLWICLPVLAACLLASWQAAQIALLFPASVDRSQIAQITQILVVGIFCNAIAQFPMAALVAAGHSRPPAMAQLLQLPGYLLLLPWLLHAFGVAGAAWAWSGRIVVDTAVLIWLARKALGNQPWRAWTLAQLLGSAMLLLAALHTA